MKPIKIMKTIKLIKFPQLLRNYSTTTKVKITPNTEVLDKIENDVYKPRRHPGIINIKTISVPSTVVTAIQNVLADYPIKRILQDSEAMNNHLKSRVSPMEPEQIQALRDQLFTKIYTKEQKRLKEEFGTVQSDEKFQQSVKDKVIYNLKEKVYNWKPLTYDAYNCLVYLMARFPMEYAVLYKIFAEIQQRDPEFKPRSMFDFGAGTGSAMWACNSFYHKLFEYFNVDTSNFMNELSLSLLNNGRGNKQGITNVFYRQFLPAHNNLYDIVISAYSLLELPSFQARMDTIIKLWNKTGKYLIIVESGTNAGFRVINEAREYLLQISESHPQSRGYVFSPCPHDSTCPRFVQDNTPCNFPISYHTLPIGGKSEVKKDLYCYIVLHKGSRNGDDDAQWPRVVRETLVRSKHTICRMCTKHARLDEVVFTAARHGKSTYQCARATKWGDRLPIDVDAPESK